MTTNNPLISVIVNCHNGQKYLDSCIKSILKQSYKNFEIIFFDNFSSDNSYQTISTPLLVLKPQTPSHISKILSIVQAHKIPLYIRGAGTGKTGGCIPVKDGIVMSMENFKLAHSQNTYMLLASREVRNGKN